jgi:hypothetical protein
MWQLLWQLLLLYLNKGFKCEKNFPEGRKELERQNLDWPPLESVQVLTCGNRCCCNGNMVEARTTGG